MKNFEHAQDNQIHIRQGDIFHHKEKRIAYKVVGLIDAYTVAAPIDPTTREVLQPVSGTLGVFLTSSITCDRYALGFPMKRIPVTKYVVWERDTKYEGVVRYHSDYCEESNALHTVGRDPKTRLMTKVEFILEVPDNGEF